MLNLLLVGALVAAVPAQAERDTFEYHYPAAVAAMPALKARLDREAATLRATFAKDVAADKRERSTEKRSRLAWDQTRNWQVVTNTPRFLSLSIEEYEFSGGAHGNTHYDALVWDKVAGAPLKPLRMFASNAALRTAIGERFCAELDGQRAERRGERINRGSGDEFDKCLDPTTLTVLLGSSSGRMFDRIGVIAAPYEAGPYAEGTYEVTLPVTPAVLAALRPEFRRYFMLKR